jgi:phage anti-repressor protein
MSELNFSPELALELFNSTEEFPVDFDVAWVWLNYSRKDSAKRHFTTCNFAKGSDYMTLLKKVEREIGATTTEKILLTVECLKVWAMMANTPQGRLVRHYFLECEKIAKQKVANSRQKPLPEFTQETVAIYMDGIKYLQDSGDIQLAQLLKNQFGNTILASQQKVLPSSEIIEQLEGVIDVAIRLGFSIPRNLECALGRHVKQFCSHLLKGQNQRYSNASAKIIHANMYPSFNDEVEKAVASYCAMKAIPNKNINLEY